MGEWNEAEKRRARASLPRLLAGRDRLTRDEKEEILSSVLGKVTAQPDRIRRRWIYTLAAACGAAVLFLAVPMWRSEEFAARGGREGGPGFQAWCTAGGRRGPCRSGTRLLFELRATPELRFFAAFAVRPDGTVIWYFPTDATGRSLDASTQPAGIASTAFDLGPEHPPGTYRLTGLFSAQALTRQEVRGRVEGSTSVGQLVERALVVE